MLRKKKLKRPFVTFAKPLLMMVYEESRSAWDNFGKFIYQPQPKTKALVRKLERIPIKLNRQHVSLLFNQTCLNEGLLPNYNLKGSKWNYIDNKCCYFIYIYIYIYIYTHTHTHTQRLQQKYLPSFKLSPVWWKWISSSANGSSI